MDSQAGRNYKASSYKRENSRKEPRHVSASRGSVMLRARATDLSESTKLNAGKGSMWTARCLRSPTRRMAWRSDKLRAPAPKTDATVVSCEK